MECYSLSFLSHPDSVRQGDSGCGSLRLLEGLSLKPTVCGLNNGESHYGTPTACNFHLVEVQTSLYVWAFFLFAFAYVCAYGEPLSMMNLARNDEESIQSFYAFL